jgi:D-arabinose 5-phosphate isomerase GutQ
MFRTLFASTLRSIKNCNNSIIAVTNKHTAKLHHVGSLYILTYDARKIKNKKLSYFRQCNAMLLAALYSGV